MESKSDLESLAWYKFPEPNGTDYLAEDLSKKEKVVELFDYCQILEAAIWAKGWQFLFQKYGLKGIIEIDSQSGWMDDEDIGEWISSIIYHSLISGFDPIRNEFGSYDDETGIFTNVSGHVLKIDWKEIYNLKDNFNS